jgi:hypothetical protein
MTAATSSAIDPLSVFLQNARPHNTVPVPLHSTAFDITIEAGLAVVSTTRLFRNAEASTIEATMTFPVPVHAVLFSLEVRIGDRRLTAAATAREAARSTYEEGIEEGKTSVLHEELLRGIHMLSVGNIPPGEEIEVKTIWAMPLMMAGGEGHLRIPTTVGQIYGQSPLADGDDFTWGADIPLADVTVRSAGAPLKIGGRIAGADPLQVRMNKPIDLTVAEWQPVPLLSRTAAGEEIKLELSPAASQSAALSLAILVDHSGSMEDGVSQGEIGATTVHGLVISALKVLSGQLGKNDYIDLWEFSNFASHIGISSGNQPPLPALIKKLSPPDGGTEINGSLSKVLGTTKADSVLLITDGKSHALDVQALAGRGKRISVLLVGEDSLEAQVGHVAALTGGDIFVAPKNAVDKIMEAALSSLRSPSQMVTTDGSSIDAPKVFCISGMNIRVTTGGTANSDARSPLEHGISALAASLQLPVLSETDAGRLAADEGLVTHLTSLVLVDEGAATQDSIPVRRRVPLAYSDSFALSSSQPAFCRVSQSVAPSQIHMRTSDRTSPTRRMYRSVSTLVGFAEDNAFRAGIDALAELINWDGFGDALSKFDAGQLDEEISAEIIRLSDSTEVTRSAQDIGVEPIQIVIILLAFRAATQANRSASRVLRVVRKSLNSADFNRILAIAALHSA